MTYTRETALEFIIERTGLPRELVARAMDTHALYLAVAGIAPEVPDGMRARVSQLRNEHRDLLPKDQRIDPQAVATFIVRVAHLPPEVVAGVLVANTALLGEPRAERDDRLQLDAWLEGIDQERKPGQN